MLCVRHVMWSSRLSPGTPSSVQQTPILGTLLPPRASSALGTAQLNKLQVVVVPKITGGDSVRRLTEDRQRSEHGGASSGLLRGEGVRTSP